MFHTARNRIKLYSRNEGKLKSYDSCVDVRAWSHDDYKRNSYLRDWIKCDMPFCVVPVYTIASFLRSMTRKRRTRITPRCHPECKSTVILDSIYSSCHAIMECLRTEGEFHNLIAEGEFETCHWPCNRCLEILKSIKLFWKIILEKLFKITVPKSKEFKFSKSESISEFAKEWKDEILKETILVKKIYPLLSTHIDINLKEGESGILNDQREQFIDNTCTISNNNNKKCKDKATTIDFVSNIDKVKNVATCSKDSSADVEKNDASCNTCPIKNTSLSKCELDNLQERLKTQHNELKRLKNENISLKMKLKHASRNNPSAFTFNVLPDSSAVLKPYEDCCKEKSELIKDIASEMIITLKNCSNKDFQNVSILQVLHKSNGIIKNDGNCYCINNKNPLEILNRVHDTFGTIVRREINIAEGNNNCHINDIKSSFHQVESISSFSKTNSTTTSSKFESETEDVMKNKEYFMVNV